MAAGHKTGGRQKGTPNKPKAASAAPSLTATGELPPLPKYEWAAIDSLVPYERNARTHSAEQIDLIVGLIEQYGWTNPVLINGAGGILAGHGRVQAARKMGMTHVPTIELKHLSEEQVRAYIIADNQSAMKAGWDDELLRLELGELQDLGFDLALTGFDEVELDALFAEDDDEASAGDGASTGKGAGSLAAQFGVPPFTVLNAREGWWQERKQAWLAIGIRSEVGRGENLGGIDAGIERREAMRGRAPNAAPGGSRMPAADDSKRQLGNGTGQAVPDAG